MLFRRFIIMIITFWVTISFAETVLIKGDFVNYDHPNQHITASDNASIHYKNIVVDTDKVFYDHKKQFLKLPGHMVLDSDNQHIEADNITYSAKTYKGKANQLDAQFNTLHIKGEKVSVSPTKIVVQNASFTSCSATPNEHYKIYAKKIYIFPTFGYFIAFNNLVELSSLPFKIPIPTYFYGSKHYGILGPSSPIPDIGSSKIEGFYIHEYLGYFLSERSSGKFFLGYSSYLGTMFGVSNVFSTTQTQTLHSRARYIGNAGYEGRLAYYVNFPDKRKQSTSGNILDDMWVNFTEAGKLPLSSLSLIFQHREVINNRRVYYTPLFSFKTYRLPLNTQGLDLTLDANFGKIAEEKDIPNPDTGKTWIFQAWRSSIDSTLTKQFHPSPLYTTTLQANYFGRWYDTGQAWNRLFGFSSIRFNVPLNPTLSYRKEITQNGFALFEYENLYTINSDEIGVSIEDNSHRLFYKVNSFTNIQKGTIRKLDITVGMSFDCWKASVKWNTQQSSINFGVELF